MLRVRAFSYFEEKGLYQQNDEETPLCFATSLCDNSNIQVQVGITNAAALELRNYQGVKHTCVMAGKLNLQQFPCFILGYCLLFLECFGMEMDSSLLLLLDSILEYIMNIDGNFSGDSVSANFQFDGNLYISADETESTCDVCNCNYTSLFII